MAPRWYESVRPMLGVVTKFLQPAVRVIGRVLYDYGRQGQSPGLRSVRILASPVLSKRRP